MFKYVVTLQSVDKNGLELRFFADNDNEVLKIVDNKLKELNLESFGYKILEIKNII